MTVRSDIDITWLSHRTQESLDIRKTNRATDDNQSKLSRIIAVFRLPEGDRRWGCLDCKKTLDHSRKTEKQLFKKLVETPKIEKYFFYGRKASV